MAPWQGRKGPPATCQRDVSPGQAPPEVSELWELWSSQLHCRKSLNLEEKYSSLTTLATHLPIHHSFLTSIPGPTSRRKQGGLSERCLPWVSLRFRSETIQIFCKYRYAYGLSEHSILLRAASYLCLHALYSCTFLFVLGVWNHTQWGVGAPPGTVLRGHSQNAKGTMQCRKKELRDPTCKACDLVSCIFMSCSVNH